MAPGRPRLRVLIAGAGIGGLAAAVSLSRLSRFLDLDIQLYEQADALREIGASIALSPNGMRTLEKLGVLNALDEDVGFRGSSGIPQIIRHWKSNQVVTVDTYGNVPDPRHYTTRFHRGHLHAALLEHVPKDSIHLGKRVTRAEAAQDEVTLAFSDGTSASGDFLVGADGIKSAVKQAFLPEYRLRFGGKVFMRSTFDFSLVEGKVPDLPADAVHWWGPHGSFFASRLGRGQYTTVGTYTAGTRDTAEIEKSIHWDQEGSLSFFRDCFKDWNPTVKALADLTPYIRLYPNYVGEAVHSWVLSDRVTLLGDAAHAHGGAFAAGGSLALDDALALGLSLEEALRGAAEGEAFASGALRKAISLYDQTRRGHTARLLDIVHGQSTGASSVLQALGPDENLLALIRSRADTTWLSEHDVERTFWQVVSQGITTSGGSTGTAKTGGDVRLVHETMTSRHSKL